MKTIEQMMEISAGAIRFSSSVCCAAFVKRLRDAGWSKTDVEMIKITAVRQMQNGYEKCADSLATICAGIIDSGSADDMSDELFAEMVSGEVYAEFALLGVSVADRFIQESKKGGR